VAPDAMRRFTRARAGERGSAILAAFFIVLLAGVVAIACLVPAPIQFREANERVHRSRARYLALEAAARRQNSMNLLGIVSPGPTGTNPAEGGFSSTTA